MHIRMQSLCIETQALCPCTTEKARESAGLHLVRDCECSVVYVCVCMYVCLVEYVLRAWFERLVCGLTTFIPILHFLRAAPKHPKQKKRVVPPPPSRKKKQPPPAPPRPKPVLAPEPDAPSITRQKGRSWLQMMADTCTLVGPGVGR